LNNFTPKTMGICYLLYNDRSFSLDMQAVLRGYIR